MSLVQPEKRMPAALKTQAAASQSHRAYIMNGGFIKVR